MDSNNGNGNPALTAPAQGALLTLYGSGNALFVHAGALQRLSELDYLQGMQIESGAIGGAGGDPDLAKVVAHWKRLAQREKGPTLAWEFVEVVRFLRTTGWMGRWRNATKPRGCKPEHCYAQCNLSDSEYPVVWSAEQTLLESPHLVRLDRKRQERLRERLVSDETLPFLAMEYLIDWGYALCDAALSSNRSQTAAQRRAFKSPNRLFYPPFGGAESASLQLCEEPKVEASLVQAKSA